MLIPEPIILSRRMECSGWPGLGHMLIPEPIILSEEWNTLIGQAWVTCSLRAELGGRGGGRVKVNLWWRFLEGHLTSCSQKGK